MNHHSSSLPTTPDLRARDLSYNTRTSSPEKRRRDGSPQLSHSEADNSRPSRSKAPSIAGCKYETGMAFSRRRIPYSIGGDQLERAKVVPKKFLDRAEIERLTGNMRELYGQILPSKESDERRARFVRRLDKILNEQWPGNDIKVFMFGSSGNMLCTSDSDVDICITTPMKALERVCFLANALAEHGMERVICVPHAKVPIVKFWDPELRLSCDMNVNNTLALENTRMIKTYVEIDERVRPLAMIIKYWTKRRILNDAALGGTLSSYTWICLILNFLQTRNPPILPSLHKKPHLRKVGADGRTEPFDDDLDKLRGFGCHNEETLGELLFYFFRRYAYDLDYENKVVSVREGKLIPKEGKKWHLMQNNRLCVEEPFNTERNLGNTADDTSFRGIHLELRRAFDLIKDAKLDKCLEEYVFPTTEEKPWVPLTEEKIWEKPPTKPAPILTRSRSQSQSTRGNRGGYNNRGGRHGNHGARAHSGRRASSAAALNKFAMPQNGVHGLGAPNGLPREQQIQVHYENFENLRLHHELFSEYQFLQAQEHGLRLRQAQALLHAMQAQGPANGAPLPQTTARDQPYKIPVNNTIPLTAPLRSGQYFHPFPYPQVSGTPQQSVHTQPSSPSMKHAQPDLRRSVHRPSAAESASAANHRSHSQPARRLPLNISAQDVPPIPATTQHFLQYPQTRQHQQLHNALEVAQSRQRFAEMQMYQDPRLYGIEQHFEEGVPKEYVGYYVNDSPPRQLYRDDLFPQRLPSYQDLQPRVKGLAPGFSRLRDASRSPSPSPAMPFRDRSFSVRSASSAPPQPSTSTAQGPIPSSRTSGPVIVNGSDGWGLPDYSTLAEASSHATTISEATSSSDDRLDETPATGDIDTPYGQSLDGAFALDEPQRYFNGQPMPDPPRVPLNNRNGNLDHVGRPMHPQAIDTTQISTKVQRPGMTAHHAGGLGIQFGELEYNRPLRRTEVLKSPEENGSTSPAVAPDQKPEQAAARIDKPFVPVPLLSPVREVRTPSPSAATRRAGEIPMSQSTSRRMDPKDLRIPTWSEIVRARQEKQNVAPSQKPNGFLVEGAKVNQVHPNGIINHVPESLMGAVYQPPQANEWQQQSGKKGKKGRPRPGSGHAVPGEPLPVNIAERKGG